MVPAVTTGRTGPVGEVKTPSLLLRAAKIGANLLGFDIVRQTPIDALVLRSEQARILGGTTIAATTDKERASATTLNLLDLFEIDEPSAVVDFVTRNLIPTSYSHLEAVLPAKFLGFNEDDFDITYNRANPAQPILKRILNGREYEGLEAIIDRAVESKKVVSEGGVLVIPYLAKDREIEGQQNIVGITILKERTGDGKISESDVKNAEQIAKSVGAKVAQVADFALRQLKDKPTGLYGRSAMEEFLNKMVAKAKRDKEQVSVLFMDIDYFKAFNTDMGHRFGNVIVKAAADILSNNVREGDLVSRYAGDEFGIVFPSTGKAQALEIAEHIRQAVAAMAVENKGVEAHITMSIGVATYDEDATGPLELIDKANEAMFAAKGQRKNSPKGERNRVVTKLTDGNWYTATEALKRYEEQEANEEAEAVRDNQKKGKE